jgi:cell wall-associated NlpC family hydrolase
MFAPVQIQNNFYQSPTNFAAPMSQPMMQPMNPMMGMPGMGMGMDMNIGQMGQQLMMIEMLLGMLMGMMMGQANGNGNANANPFAQNFGNNSMNGNSFNPNYGGSGSASPVSSGSNGNSSAGSVAPASSGSSINTPNGGETPAVKNFIDIACKQQGAPYVFGASGNGKYDCSGLVHYALNQAGVKGQRLTARGYQDKYKDSQVSKENLKPGDLVFFWSPNDRGIPKGKASHIEIYLGNGMTMGTDNPKEGAKIEPINWSTFIGGARVPELYK